jgi:hypothetical protein
MAPLNTNTLLALLDPKDEGSMTLQNIKNPVTHWHNAVDLSFQQHYCENLKSHNTAGTN